MEVKFRYELTKRNAVIFRLRTYFNRMGCNLYQALRELDRPFKLLAS